MYSLYTYDLSATNWNSVSFNTVENKTDLIHTPIYFDNGMKFNFYPFLSSVNDISFNNKTCIILTDILTRNSLFLKDKDDPENTAKLKTIKTLLTNNESKIFKHYLINESFSGLNISQNTTKLIEDQLTFHFVDSYVYIEDFYGKILTNAGIGQDSLYFTPKNQTLDDYHKWDYILYKDKIILFSYNSNFSQFLTILNNKLTVQPFDLTEDQPFNEQNILYFASILNTDESLLESSSISNSFLVKYDANPSIKENKLSTIQITSLTGSENSYGQNYLGIFPYEYLRQDGSYDFYFHGLKNYQNYRYNYTNQTNNRKYYRIYSGSNQKNGFDKIYLNYIANNIDLKFKSNENTQFYISPTTDPLDIRFCGLIENGANAGEFPYTSDRIITKRDSNLEEIPQISEIIQPSFEGNNKYLCTWLYGKRNPYSLNKNNFTYYAQPYSINTPIWYDRYYNPAKFTQNDALSASFLKYEDKFDPDQDYVFDKPSQLKLAPNILYSYYHVGNEDSKKFIDHLSYTKNENNEIIESNVLNITDWNENLKDQSFYQNNGLYFGNSGNFFGNYWKLDGTNYAVFQANQSLLQEKNLTVSLWLNFDDWSDVDAYQIFGNFYESGFGLFNESKTIAPLFTVIDTESNTIYNYNSRLSEASKLKTPLDTGDFVQRLPDLSYWVFDSQYTKAIKYSVNNSILKELDLGIEQIDQVEMGEDYIYVYDNENKTAIIIEPVYGNVLGQIILGEDCNRIEIDLNNNVLTGGSTRGVYGNCSVVDNNNNLWQVVGPNLYKNSDIIGTVGASNEMSCDIYNNIWILGEDDSYTKINRDGKFLFRYSFSKAPLLNNTNCPPSTAPEPPKLKVLDEDLPFLSTTDYKFILTLPDYYLILVTPPKPKPKPLIPPYPKRKRAIDFINAPVLKKVDKNLSSICGLSAIEVDKVVIVDMTDNQAYILNQLGQVELKINLENLAENDKKVDFRTGGDFTGYQHIRKYKNIQNTTLTWKIQLKYKQDEDIEVSQTIQLPYDASQLAKGWHHFCLTISLDQENEALDLAYYVDSNLINLKRLNDAFSIYNSFSDFKPSIDYKNRTSLIIGATTVKNTLLNNFLNISEGYKMNGSIADVKMYNYAISPKDIEQLYYSSDFAPKIKELTWNMPIGQRNYVEEISEWFKLQLPTHKSKFYNINIHNLNIEDKIKQNIENSIKKAITKISPSYTALNKINWITPKTQIKNLPKATDDKYIRDTGSNSVFMGFGASTGQFTNEHWIHDFYWTSEADSVDMSDLLANNQLISDAKIINGSIRLTNNDALKFGNIFYYFPLATEVDGKLLDWTAYYAISMGGSNTLTRGEGLTFIIKGSNDGFGSNGFGLGYYGIDNSIAIGYDTFQNSEIYTNDTNNNHVELNASGSLKSLTLNNPSFDFCGETGTSKFIHTWVQYEASSKFIRVFVSEDPNTPTDAIIEYPLDIREYINFNQ